VTRQRRSPAIRLVAAAAAVLGLLLVPLAGGATVSASAVQSQSVNADEVKIVFTNTGDVTLTSFRQVVPPPFAVKSVRMDGASCSIPVSDQYRCTGLSVPPGTSWTAYFVTSRVYADQVGFVTSYIAAVGPSDFYVTSGGTEQGPLLATWESDRPSFDDDAQCVVPRVRGKTLKVARRMIARADCATGKVRRAWSRQGVGRVTNQLPPAGIVLDRKGKVNLVVSRGKRSSRKVQRTSRD
jgi:hypothetical protein